MSNILRFKNSQFPQLEMFQDEAAVREGGPSRVDERERAQLGRYAEFMVCAELTKLGYFVTHVDAPGFDLILVCDDMSVRVQVKSTTYSENGFCIWDSSKGTYRRLAERSESKRRARLDRIALSRRDTDLLALFHHQFGTTIFMLIDEVKGYSVRLPVSQVREHEAAKSLERALAVLALDN